MLVLSGFIVLKIFKSVYCCTIHITDDSNIRLKMKVCSKAPLGKNLITECQMSGLKRAFKQILKSPELLKITKNVKIVKIVKNVLKILF